MCDKMKKQYNSPKNLFTHDLNINGSLVYAFKMSVNLAPKLGMGTHTYAQDLTSSRVPNPRMCVSRVGAWMAYTHISKSSAGLSRPTNHVAMHQAW